MMDNDEREARRRVEEAMRLIASAYRLHPIDPRDTVARLRSAIAYGVEEQAEDIKEAARNA